MASSRLILIPVLKEFRISTDTTANAFTLDLNVEAFRHVLPHASELIFFYNMIGAVDANLLWNLTVIPGFDRQYEAASFNLSASDITANGPGRVSYTTVANFLLEGRFRLTWKNNGTGTQRTALVSAAVGVLTYGT